MFSCALAYKPHTHVLFARYLSFMHTLWYVCNTCTGLRVTCKDHILVFLCGEGCTHRIWYTYIHLCIHSCKQYINIYIYTCIHYIHIYIHIPYDTRYIYTHIYIHTCNIMQRPIPLWSNKATCPMTSTSYCEVSMCVDIYKYIYIHTYIHINIFVHICCVRDTCLVALYTYIQTCISTCILHVHIHTHMHTPTLPYWPGHCRVLRSLSIPEDDLLLLRKPLVPTLISHRKIPNGCFYLCVCVNLYTSMPWSLWCKSL